ncbi:hypothetical protein ACHQM5_005378 [Ranunculus cassubicifolius]
MLLFEELRLHRKGEHCRFFLTLPYKEIENGVLWEVEGKWVVQGAVDVDIGANPSAEGGGEDEGVDDQVTKCVDIVVTFRIQEQHAFDKKQFLHKTICFVVDFVGESMADDGVVVLAYYKEGAIDPTFLYFAHGLEEVKC